jgi:hypothetical protein
MNQQISKGISHEKVKQISRIQPNHPASRDNLKGRNHAKRQTSPSIRSSRLG